MGVRNNNGELVIISGQPPEGISYTHYTSYINEYIWSTDPDDGKRLNNCYISQDQGMIRTSREIAKGEEVTIYLGSEYDWDTYKHFLIENCIKTIREIISSGVVGLKVDWSV